MKTHPSIRRLLLWIVVAVAVPIIGLGLYSTLTGLKNEADQTRTAAYTLAQLTATHTEQFLSESEDLMAALAARPLIRAVDGSQCDPFLSDFRTLFPQYFGLGLVDVSGNVVCSATVPEGEPLPYVGDRPYFQEVMSTEKFTVSDALVGRVNGVWVVVLAYPVYDEGGKLVGALTMPIDLARFKPGLDEVDLPPGASITIINDGGTVVARSVDSEKWVGRNVLGTEVVNFVLSEDEGTAQGKSVDGIEKLYGFTTIPSVGWHVFSGVPTAVAFASLQDMVLRQAFLSLFIIVLAAILAAYLTSQIERPAQALAQVARDVAAGQLHKRASVRGPAEFVQVAQQFNTMLDVRARHIAQLEQRAQQLAAVGEMGQVIASTLDLNELLNLVLEQVSRMVPAEGIAVLLLEQEQLFFAAANGLAVGKMESQRRLVKSGIAAEVIESGHSIWVRDATTRQHLFQSLEASNGFQVQTLQVVPLKLQGVVIGVVEAIHSKPDAFSGDDLQLLEAAASWIAIAIGNARLFGEVRSTQEQLRRLAQQVVTIQEEERRRISYELHDETGQVLTALKIHLSLIKNDLPDELDEAQQGIAHALELTDQTLEQIRLLARHLRPPGMANTGLDAIIDGLCRDFASSTQMSLIYRGTELPALPDATAITLYRFAQEALTNAAKHAQATEIKVALDFDDGLITLSVADNGQGFQVETISSSSIVRPQGIGLLGIQERVNSLNGRLEIESELGQGTKLVAKIGLPQVP